MPLAAPPAPVVTTGTSPDTATGLRVRPKSPRCQCVAPCRPASSFGAAPWCPVDVAGGSKPQHRLARPRGGGGGGVDSGSIFLPWAHAHLGSFAASHCGLPPRCPSEFVPCRPGQVPAIGLLGRPRLGSVTAQTSYNCRLAPSAVGMQGKAG